MFGSTILGAAGFWELAGETALAFVRDEITVEEFVDRIFDAMTERSG